MPKLVHFGEFLKIWSLRSNSITRQVSFNRTKKGGKCQNATFWVIFKQCELVFLAFFQNSLNLSRDPKDLFSKHIKRFFICKARKYMQNPILVYVYSTTISKSYSRAAVDNFFIMAECGFAWIAESSRAKFHKKIFTYEAWKQHFFSKSTERMKLRKLDFT